MISSTMNIFDLIYPNDIYCVACGRPLPAGTEAALCGQCAEKIHWITGRLCEKCGKPLVNVNRKTLCGDCAQEEHRFRKGYACALYEGPAAGILRDMKYRSRPAYADAVSALMAARARAEADPETGELPVWDAIIPVPMYQRKKEKRGYDQAELLARGLSKQLGLPLFADILLRIRETGVMSSLSLGERKQNLSAAFCVRDATAGKLSGKTVLLLDDVYTTGSTADACTEALLAAGCIWVDLIVFATGSDGGQISSGDEEADAALFYNSADNLQFR